ncbi:Elongator complex protein 5 [Bagarius yarrelli]|uniref:Elongator complex protein 5 n=1 Tax=Bagarius yarrelli TaxID=175774 RepID=A0A556TYX6_BAGYA|nr:Elongator complex protein 5 [Bagarius yarrelli]
MLSEVLQELEPGGFVIIRGGSVRNIVGLLHADLHQPGIIGALSHLASAVITVKPVNNARYAVAKISQRKKSGKVMQKVDPTSNLTFNLRLSETEKEAKERVALPFVFSEEKKSAFLKHGRGTGRIMYEPDANDDFDEEDPDDDLDV